MMIIKNLKQIYQLLDKKLQKRMRLMLPITFIGSLLELIGVAVLIPFVILLLKDDWKSLPIFVATIKYFPVVIQNNFLNFLIVSLLILMIIKNVLSVLITRFQEKFINYSFRHISSKVLDLILSKPLSYFKNTESHIISRNVILVPRAIVSEALKPLMLIFNELILSFLIITLLVVFFSKIILIIVLMLIPVMGLFFYFVKNKISYLGQLLNQLIPKTNRPIYNLAHGYIDVKMNRAEGELKLKFLDNLLKEVKTRINLATISSIPNRLIEISLLLIVIELIFICKYLGLSQDEVISMLSIMGLAIYKLLPSLNRILASMVTLRKQKNSLEILGELINSGVKEFEFQEVEPIKFDHVIECENLSFTYEGQESSVVNNVSLSIKKGECIGFIGSSGSGKTTLLNIFLRFLIEQKGQITIDGVTLDQSNLQSWRSITGYVCQDNFLVEGTIGENIAFGRDKIDKTKLQECIRLAALDELVKSLPDKENTKIGESGGLLSGGQRQRVSIARAIYGGAKILVLDEATSALDNETESQINTTINSLKEQGYTVIMVAHRYTSLSTCDRIIELKNGEIAQELNYSELLKSHQV